MGSRPSPGDATYLTRNLVSCGPPQPISGASLSVESVLAGSRQATRAKLLKIKVGIAPNPPGHASKNKGLSTNGRVGSAQYPKIHPLSPPGGMGDIADQIERLDAHLRALPYRERRRFLKRNTTPPYPWFMYKFRALDDGNKAVDRLRQILCHSMLYLAAPDAFNDPFDMRGRVVATPGGSRYTKWMRALGKFKPDSLETNGEETPDQWRPCLQNG